MMKILTMCAAMWMLCGMVFAQAPAAGKNFSVSLPVAMNYQWKKDGTAISGATSASYKISSVKSGDAGSYTVTVSNTGGNVTSSAAKLTVNLKAPTISSQPKSQTVNGGSSVTFSVVASGSELSYQWKKDGVAISGATKASYTISSAKTSDAGNYTVTVSNTGGNVTSSVAKLTVNLKAPTISTQPKSQTIAEGKSVTFSVTVTGSELKYQWKKGGTAISGATSSSYTISSVKPGDAGSYTVTVNNSAGTVTSSAAVLTVTAKPTISTQPKSQTVTEGNAVTFSVTATSTGLSYQWKKDGVAISGATSASYTISSTKRSDAGSYTVTVSNTAGSVTSSAAKLTVNLKAPTISTQPKSQTVTEGDAVTLTVTVTGSELSYQWYQDGSPVSGATSASYKINSVKPSDAGSYTVKVSNTAGSVTSSAAKLTVNLKAPTITTQPASQTITEESSVTFSVTATGTAVSYQWKKNGTAISGATKASYTISSVQKNDAGSYTVTVTNSGGTVTSSAAVLTVKLKVPTITTQPTHLTVSKGSSATFTVKAKGTDMSYQWYKDGNPISGATKASYTISSVTENSAGNYTVKVSNVSGNVTSSAAKLTVALGDAISYVYKKGKHARVTLHIDPMSEVNSYFVEEILPVKTAAVPYTLTMSTNNAYGGVYSSDNHAIRWNFFDRTARDLEYYVKVPWNCYGSMALNGTVVFTESQSSISGDRLIDFSEKLHPADLDDYMDISTQEIANYCMAWRKFENWERPSSASGSYTIDVMYAARGVQIWLYGSDYLYKSAKTEPSCWIAELEPQASIASDEYLDMGEQIPEGVVRAASEGDSTSTRTIRKNGNTANVSLSLRPDPEVIIYFVEEIVPTNAGIEITNVSDGGVYLKEKGTIRWAFMDGSARDLSYTVNLTSGYTGTVTLKGSTTFNTTEVQTTGDSVISDVTAPSITAQPKSQTVNEGSLVTFSVTATGSDLKYQWKKNGSNISGATKSSYTINSAMSGDEGSYTVTVSNSAGNVTSSAATLTVKTEPPPTGLSVRRSVNVTGNKATVTLTISNAPKGYFGSLEETWQRKDITFSGISNGGTAAETENGMKVSWSGFDMSGNYQIPGTLTYTASVPEGTSATVALSGQLMITTPSETLNADIDTVNVTFTAAPAAPVITVQPKSQTVSEGSSVTLSVTATGSAPLIYQWFKNNSLLSGANGSSYTIPSASTSDTGTYMVMVTNPQGAVMSSPVTLTVTQGGVPELSLTQTSGGKWKITFTGTLQESTDMKSWKNVSGTQSGAYTFTPAKGKKFYRAVK